MAPPEWLFAWPLIPDGIIFWFQTELLAHTVWSSKSLYFITVLINIYDFFSTQQNQTNPIDSGYLVWMSSVTELSSRKFQVDFVHLYNKKQNNQMTGVDQACHDWFFIRFH